MRRIARVKIVEGHIQQKAIRDGEGMGCHIKLPVKAHLSLAQPHTHKSGMVACEERERGTIWTSPPMARPIIEISKTCPDMDTHSEMR